jgi:hypothetical protein
MKTYYDYGMNGDNRDANTFAVAIPTGNYYVVNTKAVVNGKGIKERKNWAIGIKFEGETTYEMNVEAFDKFCKLYNEENIAIRLDMFQ